MAAGADPVTVRLSPKRPAVCDRRNGKRDRNACLVQKREFIVTVDFDTLPAPSGVRLVDFDEAHVVPGIVPNTFILVVSGTKPYLNMDVDLVPRVYVRQPEYWGIEVTGMVAGIVLPTEAPYTVTIPLDGIRGTIGIDVIGATTTQKIDVP
jgi:hypothetical protein